MTGLLKEGYDPIRGCLMGKWLIDWLLVKMGGGKNDFAQGRCLSYTRRAKEILECHDKKSLENQ